MAYLLHSTATLPTRAYQNYDLRYHLNVETNKAGETFIQVTEPAPNEASPVLSRSMELRVETDMIERLINIYFNDLAPNFPVITRQEFLETSPPPPILLYAICSVAAASREISSQVFENLRNAVSMVIKSEDVLSTTSMSNVQALLVLGMCGDCHSRYVPAALSAFWLRVGTAVRMVSPPRCPRNTFINRPVLYRHRIWDFTVQSR